jgi:hypothetical protein
MENQNSNKHQQIIALTTKLNEMETKLLKISKPSFGGSAPVATPSKEQQEKKGYFPLLWQINKIVNGTEHSMIKHDCAKWYWCRDGHSFENKPCGMYCMHTPGISLQ